MSTPLQIGVAPHVLKARRCFTSEYRRPAALRVFRATAVPPKNWDRSVDNVSKANTLPNIEEAAVATSIGSDPATGIGGLQIPSSGHYSRHPGSHIWIAIQPKIATIRPEPAGDLRFAARKRGCKIVTTKLLQRSRSKSTLQLA